MADMPYEMGSVNDFEWRRFLAEVADVDVAVGSDGLKWLNEIAEEVAGFVAELDDDAVIDGDAICDAVSYSEFVPSYIAEAIRVFLDLDLECVSLDDMGIGYGVEGTRSVADIVAMALGEVAYRMVYQMLDMNSDAVKRWKWRALPEEARAVAMALDVVAA